MAHELAEQLLVLAQPPRAVYLIEAYLAMGIRSSGWASLPRRRTPLEQAIALYDSSSTVAGVPVWDGSGGRVPLYAAWALWLLAIRTRARRRSAEALTLARAVALPSLAVAWPGRPSLHQSCREVLMVQSAPRRSWGSLPSRISVVAGSGTTFRLGIGQQTGAEEMVRLHQGQAPTSLQGRAGTDALACPPSEAHGTVGQAEEGLGLLREALVVVEKVARIIGKRSCIGSRATCCCTDRSGCPASGSMFLPGPRHGPPPAGEVTRTAGGDEPGTAVAAAGQTCRCLPDAR